MSSSRDQDATEVPIASLIDVVFLLIMFFVVTADLDAEATDTTLKLVKADNIKKPEGPINPNKVIINIFYRYNEPTEFRVGTQSLTDKQIIPYFKNTFGGLPANQKQLVIIRAAGEVKHKYVDIALRAATEAKFAAIKITAEIAAPE